MKLLTPLLLSAALALPAQAADSCSTVHGQLLKATHYAEIIRTHGSNQCASRSLPNFISLCANIGRATPASIEAMALPGLRQALSCPMAQQGLAFWDSPNGKLIATKQMQALARNRPAQLSLAEQQQLNGFLATPAGQNLNLYLNDTRHSNALLQRIAASGM